MKVSDGFHNGLYDFDKVLRWMHPLFSPRNNVVKFPEEKSQFALPHQQNLVFPKQFPAELFC